MYLPGRICLVFIIGTISGQAGRIVVFQESFI